MGVYISRSKFQGFSEELVFRGYLLSNFMESMNKYYALLYNSILFALMHSVNPNFNFIDFINLFLAGLLLGLPYVYTKNLWYPMSLHFAWNFFQGPVFGLDHLLLFMNLDQKGLQFSVQESDFISIQLAFWLYPSIKRCFCRQVLAKFRNRNG